MSEMSPKAKEKLNEFNAAQADWYTLCPKCHTPLKGTLADLKKHSCQGAGNGS